MADKDKQAAADKDRFDKASVAQAEAMKKFMGKKTHEVSEGLPKAKTPTCVRTMKGGPDLGKVYAVAWSSDSSVIAACHQAGAVTLKTAANGAHKNLPIIFPSKDEKIVPMACEFFSGDRMLAVGGMDNVVTLFDRTQTTCEKKKVLVGHEGYISAIKMLGDKMVTGSGDSTAMIWDVATGACVSTYAFHDGDISGVDTLGGDPNMFVTSSTDCTCRVFDARQPGATRVFKAKYGVNAIALFPTGTGFVCGCDSASWEVWDIGAYNQIGRGKVKRGRCETIALSSSGAYTIMGWDAPEAGFVMMAETFNVDAQVKAEVNSHTDLVGSVAVAPDGSAFASGSFDTNVKVWTAAPGA